MSTASGRNAITWPGPEIGDEYLRGLAQKLVREQGWQYIYRGGHPILRAPDKAHGQLPFASTASDWRARLNTVAQLKRMGARLDDSPVTRAQTVTPPVFTDGMGQPDVDMPWTDSEWRERQREEVWWRQRFAPEPKPVHDAEVIEPEVPAWSAYGQELMARLDRGTVRPDARGTTWTLAAARQLVKDGYSVDHAVNVSGWGRMWFADLA